MDLPNGKQLGAYRVIERLVSGGMATVYRAMQPSTEREVAIKVLPPQFAAEPESLARFEREARMLANLQHPHILGIIDYGREDGLSYIVMPLLRHGDLGDYVAREGRALELAEIRRVMLQLADALDYAHGQGVIHRDLKPSNILMDGRGNCLLSDFGIARLAGSTPLTAAGLVIGTPEYMSPEQGSGAVIDARSDIYSLGVILYQLATGNLPYRATSPTLVMIAHQEAPLPPPRSLNAEIPLALERVITTALSKRPDQRYSSAGEFAAALRRALPEAPSVDQFATQPMARPAPLPVSPDETPTGKRRAVVAPAPPVPAVTPAAGARRMPVWAWAAIGLGIGLGILLGVARWLDARQREAAAEVVAAKAPPPAPSPATSTAPASAATKAPAEQLSIGEELPGDTADAYDDFDASANDGGYDTELWQATSADAPMQNVQRDGVLVVSTRAQAEGLYATLTDTALKRVAVRLHMKTPVEADQATLGVVLSRADQKDWWVSCYLFASAGKDEVTPACTDQARKVYRYAATPSRADWHDLELRPDPNYDRVLFSADGAALGELPMPPLSGGGNPTWYVTLSGWSGNGKAVEGEFDVVHIESAD